MADKANEKLPETPASPATPEIDDNDYDAAFDEASDVTPVVVDDPAPAPASKEEVAETPPKTPETPETPATPETPETPETPASPPADVAALERKVAELEGQLAEKANAEPTPSTPEKPETPAAPAELSDEDRETMEEVQQDWPSIYKTMELQISQLEARIATLLDSKLAGIQQQLKPVLQVTAETTQDKFMAAIEKVHPGAKAQLPELDKWIATKPSFMQKSMNAILDEGSAAEVIELFDQWKAEVGEETPEDPNPNPNPNPDDKTNRRLANMEDVRTERTGFVADDQDPNDFDGAFDEASSQ